MSKKARYDGPYLAVTVEVLPGVEVEVERGHQLPTEINGEPVPAAKRDSLLETPDWSEVTAPSTTKEKS